MVAEGTHTHCSRVLSALRSEGVKPRLYWTYYASYRRGYWRMSTQPKLRTKKVLDLWAYAHKMAREINAQERPVT